MSSLRIHQAEQLLVRKQILAHKSQWLFAHSIHIDALQKHLQIVLLCLCKLLLLVNF